MAASPADPRQLAGASETVALGAALAGACPQPIDGPRLLFLSGELGAGKTTLAAGLLQALGVAEVVRSPSYALVETYPIAWGSAVHVDCYRLNDPSELELLGLRDYFTPNSIWVVEWPERAAEALPPPDLWLQLRVTDSGRQVEFEAKSAAGGQWLERLFRFDPYVANKT